MKTEQLIIYRNLKYQDLLDRTAALLAGEGQEDPYACANDLIELAAAYGLEGNLWHCFLALCLANNENAYSTSCEIVGEIEGSLNQLVKHDFAVFKELFDCDIARLDEYTEGKPVWTELKSYKAANGNSRIFNKRIRDRIVELAVSLEKSENEDAFQQMVTEFYREFGVGKFGLNKAFRVVERERMWRSNPSSMWNTSI